MFHRTALVSILVVAAASHASAAGTNNFPGEGISGTTGSVTGNTTNADKETGEPNHAGNTGGKSFWFSWTADKTGWCTFHTVGSSFDTLLAVYTGSSVNGLTLVPTLGGTASDDDIKPSYDYASLIQFPCTQGQVYRIAVDGFLGAFGTFKLRWKSAAARVFCTSRISRFKHAGVNRDLEFGDLTSESRRPSGGNFKLIFTFSKSVVPYDGFLGIDEFRITGATFVKVTQPAPNQIALTVTALDASRIDVVFQGLFVGGLSTPALDPSEYASLRVLKGDVNSDNIVGPADVALINTKLNRPAGANSFLYDVNLSGTIDASDVSAVQAKYGSSAPSTVVDRSGVSYDVVEHHVAAGGSARVVLANPFFGEFEHVAWFVGDEPAEGADTLELDLPAGTHAVTLVAFDGGCAHVLKTTVRVLTFEQACDEIVAALQVDGLQGEACDLLLDASDEFHAGRDSAGADLLDAALALLDPNSAAAHRVRGLSLSVRQGD